MKNAVLYVIFNRLDTVKQTFEKIRQAQPEKLYIAADGARNDVTGEAQKCLEVREYVTSHVDWECEVKTLFRDKNLGCQQAPKQAIDWFFENEEQGIILEDDCLVSPDFFKYAEELLEKYKYDTRIMLISGDNFQQGQAWGDGSYYFSKMLHIWGWASWRRAWKLFDIEMKTFPQFVKENKIKDIFNNPSIQWYWLKNFYRAYSKKLKTCWDYQFAYAMCANNMLSVVPNVNLVQNIGFDANSTHTNFNPDEYSIPVQKMDKIIHPSIILQYNEADEFEHKSHYKIDLSKSRAFMRKLFGNDKIKL